MFLLFALFGIAATALAHLISVFFSRAKTAALIGGTAFLVSFFPYYSVANATTARTSKFLACLSAPIAFGLGLNIAAEFEGQGQGVTFSTMGIDAFSVGFSLREVVGALVLDTLIYLILAWYLDKVRRGRLRRR